jgi:hypothetical protein
MVKYLTMAWVAQVRGLGAVRLRVHHAALHTRRLHTHPLPHPQASHQATLLGPIIQQRPYSHCSVLGADPVWKHVTDVSRNNHDGHFSSDFPLTGSNDSDK